MKKVANNSFQGSDDVQRPAWTSGSDGGGFAQNTDCRDATEEKITVQNTLETRCKGRAASTSLRLQSTSREEALAGRLASTGGPGRQHCQSGGAKTCRRATPLRQVT